MIRKKQTLYILLLILSFSVGYFLKSTTTKPAITEIPPSDSLRQNVAGCESQQRLGDLTGDGKPEYVLFCGNIININYPPTDNIFAQKVEDISSFYDLFHFIVDYDSKKLYENYWTTKEAYVFPKDKPRFFAITSLYYSGGSSLIAFGVYRIEEKKIKRVFQSKFSDMKGRNSSVVFSENKPSFTTTALSLDDGKTTIINYGWNEEKHSFEKGETQILLLNGIPVDQVEAECANNNGIWMKGNFNTGFYCNIKYADGGKACNDSSDCLSNQCISYLKVNNESNRAGQCANFVTNLGCYGLIKKGKLTNFACFD